MMLETVKATIKELPDISFGEFYQNYICDIQDQNILVEVQGIKTEDIITIEKLIAKLKNI